MPFEKLGVTVSMYSATVGPVLGDVYKRQVSTGRWALATAERNGARLATDMSPAPEGAR